MSERDTIEIWAEQLADDEEFQELVEELRDIYDKLVIKYMEKVFKVKIEIVDDNHVTIDGKLYDTDEFQAWIEDKCFLYYPEESSDTKLDA